MTIRASRSAPFRLVSWLTVFVAVATMGSSCSSCDAKCVGSSAEVTVASDVAAVEACDSAGKCTRQEFGPASANTLNRSFRFTASGTDGKVSLDVRTFGQDGRPAASGHAVSKMSPGGSGSCGCKGPAKFFVSSEQVSAM